MILGFFRFHFSFFKGPSIKSIRQPGPQKTALERRLSQFHFSFVIYFANLALKKPLWKDGLVNFIFHLSFVICHLSFFSCQRAINQINRINSPTWPSKTALKRHLSIFQRQLKLKG
ncbi:MAG: hypothetical protein DRR08_14670 [Candidatus Parabeggiatoa sp. nov. 2]|nr:MAG: hypothetical protein B6247_20435 [Beggiatoa sp. 4572_84]RKZ59168.1 MAG: hypothetical protein DRR08_14670 [Gammaproteobacteria bacterium]